jgi:TonB family protein
MRFPLLVFLAPILVCAASAQNTTNTAAKAPKDPRELLAAARAAYDFDDASLKPWNLKGKYQLFDEKGNPGEQGTYEYWWTAPGVYRSTWSRPGGMRTEWHSADGRIRSVASGGRILEIERELRDLLVSAVPDVSKLKPGEANIERDEVNIGKVTLRCATLQLRRQKDGRTPIIPGVRSGTYCFSEPELLLAVQHESNAEYTEFHHLRKIQGRIIAGEIARSFSGRYLFKFSLDEMRWIDAKDPAMQPTTDAKVTADDSGPSSTAAQARPINKVPPIYPPAAKSAHTTGSVLLDVLIGAEGKVHDIVVLASSSPLLTAAAKDAVSQWQYSPYVVDGEPQEVTTRVKVTFTMAGR